MTPTPTDKVRAALEGARQELWDSWHSHISQEQFDDDPTIQALTKALSAMDGMVLVKDWQPIETAPLDGTNLLLYGGDWVYEARWQDGQWYTAYKNGDEPTHWMIAPYVKGD